MNDDQGLPPIDLRSARQDDEQAARLAELGIRASADADEALRLVDAIRIAEAALEAAEAHEMIDGSTECQLGIDPPRDQRSRADPTAVFILTSPPVRPLCDK